MSLFKYLTKIILITISKNLGSKTNTLSLNFQTKTKPTNENKRYAKIASICLITKISHHFLVKLNIQVDYIAQHRPNVARKFKNELI